MSYHFNNTDRELHFVPPRLGPMEDVIKRLFQRHLTEVSHPFDYNPTFYQLSHAPAPIIKLCNLIAIKKVYKPIFCFGGEKSKRQMYQTARRYSNAWG